MKNQVALFFDGEDPAQAAHMYKELEKVAGEFAGRMIGLFVDIADKESACRPQPLPNCQKGQICPECTVSE